MITASLTYGAVKTDPFHCIYVLSWIFGLVTPCCGNLSLTNVELCHWLVEIVVMWCSL